MNGVNLNSELIHVVGDEVWMVHSQLNILISVNLITNVQKEYIIPYTEVVGGFYISLLEYNNSLILIPGSASRFVFFDISNEVFNELPIDNPETRWYFGGAFIKDQILYAIPREGEIKAIDLNELIFLEDECTKSVKEKSYDGYYYAGEICGHMILANFKHAGFLVVDKNGKSEWILESDFSPSEYDLYSKNDCVYIHNPHSRKIYVYDFSTEELKELSESTYAEPGALICVRDGLIVLDYYFKNVLEYVDLYTTNANRQIIKESDHKNRETYHGAFEIANDKTLWFNNCTGELQIFEDIEIDPIKSISVIISKETILQLQKKGIIKGLIKENSVISLKEYMLMI